MNKTPSKPKTAARASAAKSGKTPTAVTTLVAPAEGATGAPRADTKLGKVVSLLSAAKGASITDLTQATGWLPHTTRAALTGLRRRGFSIETERSSEAPTRYRIAATAGTTKRSTRRAAASA